MVCTGCAGILSSHIMRMNWHRARQPPAAATSSPCGMALTSCACGSTTALSMVSLLIIIQSAICTWQNDADVICLHHEARRSCVSCLAVVQRQLLACHTSYCWEPCEPVHAWQERVCVVVSRPGNSCLRHPCNLTLKAIKSGSHDHSLTPFLQVQM